MIASLATFFAQTAPVPDTGVTGLLLGAGLLSLAIVAKVLKNSKR